MVHLEDGSWAGSIWPVHDGLLCRESRKRLCCKATGSSADRLFKMQTTQSRRCSLSTSSVRKSERLYNDSIPLLGCRLQLALMSLARYTLIFFSPKNSTSGILNTLFAKFPKSLGSIGQYENCAFISQGTGQYSNSNYSGFHDNINQCSQANSNRDLEQNLP